MDNQHELITGYRSLSQEELDLMNEVKKKANEVGELCVKVAKTQGIDPRWAAEGKTDLQKGFMSLVRSIAQPDSF